MAILQENSVSVANTENLGGLAIATLQKTVKEMRSGKGKVAPGQPLSLEAASIGDGIWQGDLGVEVIKDLKTWVKFWDKQGVELAYKKVKFSGMFQLVPGNSSGARHCIDEKSVDVYTHNEYDKNYDGYVGPVIFVKQDTEIPHPKHGNVKIFKDTWIGTQYQRNLDIDRRIEARAKD